MEHIFLPARVTPEPQPPSPEPPEVVEAAPPPAATSPMTHTTDFPCAEWLRQEGRVRDDMDAGEADWCAKMNRCADEIERLLRQTNMMWNYMDEAGAGACEDDLKEAGLL